MTPSSRALFARAARAAGAALAVCGGVLLHTWFPLTVGPAVPLVLSVALLAAVVVVVYAAARERRATAEHTRSASAREERLRLLESAVIHAHDAVVVLEAEPDSGPGRRVLYVNDAFCRMTGYARDEVVGRSLHVLRGPASDPDTLGRLRAALATGTSLQAELQNYRKDGSVFWVELSLVPVHGPTGRIDHWVMVQRDATARKRAEEQTRQASQLLRSVIDAFPGQISARDADARYLLMNAYQARLFGTTPEAAVGRTDGELISPEHGAANAGRFREVIRTGELLQYEEATPDATGVVRPWLTTMAPLREPPDPNDRPGAIRGVVNWSLDVTARRKIEDALRQSESLFRGIFEGSSAGISLTDPAGRFISCNPAFATMVGRTVEEVLALTPVNLTHPEDWAEQVPLFDEVQAGTRDRFNIAKRYLRPDGEIVWVELSFAAIRGPLRQYEYGLGVSLNITERKKLEEQLRQAHKMEAVGQMAGGIAHDFNNLLTAVLGNLDQLRLPADDPNRALIAAVEQAVGRAADLTRKLLGYARRSQLVAAPVAPQTAFDEVIGLLGRTLGPRIRLEVRVARGCDPVLADPTLLNQVLVNLCLNARDAMPGGGTLTLSAGPIELDADAANTNPDARPGRFVQLSVTDTGTGVAQEVRGRLFEPFFTTKPVGQGTGLGLAMVQGIVKQHHGWVAWTSNPGAGTRFDIYLPMVGAPDGEAALVAPPAATPHDTGQRTILLVDDEAMIRDLGRLVLESAGFRVFTANDGMDAVEVFSREQPLIDLVVLDVTMPRMSGRDAFRHITRLDPKVRVLFSTGYSAEELTEVDSTIGLLTKPYRPHELLGAVRDTLARGQPGGG